jgi:hypothetical protein
MTDLNKLADLIRSLEPFEHKRAGSLRIGVDEIRAILSALRRVEKPSLFVVDNDQGQSWDRLDEVADALTDYGAEPRGFGKVYRWCEMEPVWVVVDTVNDERIINEYATEEAARLALKTEGE